MDFFSHETIKKYTASMLDTFNDIYVRRTDVEDKELFHNVPITFGSKDKAMIFSDLDLEQWKSGNYNILPRMSLSLTSLDKDNQRNTNRLHTINQTINGDVITFQYNAVAYILNYELDIATKSLTELSMILEQILPYFNPTLNLSIMELDFLAEPTSVPVHLNSTSLDLPDTFAMEDGLRIVGAKLSLSLKGNLYMPYKDAAVIKQVRLYMNNQMTNTNIRDVNRTSKLEFEVDDITNTMKQHSLYKLDFEQENTINKLKPNYYYNILPDGSHQVNSQNQPILINNGLFIDGNSVVNTEDRAEYKLTYVDPDDETGFIFVWNVLSGTALIQQNNVNPVRILFGTTPGVVVLQGQVIDRSGNASIYVTKEITVQ